MSKLALQDVQLLAAMSPPGGSSNEVSGRMLRHLNVITLHDFSETTMTHIFSNIVNIHFKVCRIPYVLMILRMKAIEFFIAFNKDACLKQFQVNVKKLSNNFLRSKIFNLCKHFKISNSKFF